MSTGFREMIIGGVLVAPFMTYAAAALVLLLVIRPVLQFVRFADAFDNPSLATVSLYLIILAVLYVLFPDGGLLANHH